MQTAAFLVFDAGENTQKFKVWTPLSSSDFYSLIDQRKNMSDTKYSRSLYDKNSISI